MGVLFAIGSACFAGPRSRCWRRDGSDHGQCGLLRRVDLLHHRRPAAVRPGRRGRRRGTARGRAPAASPGHLVTPPHRLARGRHPDGRHPLLQRQHRPRADRVGHERRTRSTTPSGGPTSSAPSASSSRATCPTPRSATVRSRWMPTTCPGGSWSATCWAPWRSGCRRWRPSTSSRTRSASESWTTIGTFVGGTLLPRRRRSCSCPSAPRARPGRGPGDPRAARPCRRVRLSAGLKGRQGVPMRSLHRRPVHGARVGPTCNDRPLRDDGLGDVDDTVEQDGEVGRLRAGDPLSWETLYRRVYPSMLAYARRRVATTEEAQDAVSEALTRTVAGIDRLAATRRRP